MRRRALSIRSLLLLVPVFTGVTVMAAVLTVDDHGPADFSSIQAAINAAINTDEIVVKPGRYHETLSFLGKSITVRSEDGPQSTVVFLEGQTRIVLLDGDSTLSGFTITGGQQRVGGGILVTGGANPVIAGNIIENNTAMWNSFTGFPGMGGAIAVESPSHPVITRNVIRGNRSLGDSMDLYGWGGSILISDYASATITNNLIVESEAAQIGGSIYVGLSGAVTPVVITNNTILGSQAGGIAPDTTSYGGGISVFAGAQATIQNNIIANSVVQYLGGGIYFFANNDNGINYSSNDFDNNQPQNCSGIPASKCDGGQFTFVPSFLDPLLANYRLRSDSELIDRGVSGSQGSLDAEGRVRTVDSDLDGVATPDIGAFENQRELTRLRFADKDTLVWDPSRNALMVFDVYRDALSSLGPGNIGVCWKTSLAGTTTTDMELVPTSDGFFYLAVGREQAVGSLGFGRDDTERIAFTPCP